MHDLALWRALTAPDQGDIEGLAEGLSQLARRPVELRWPFFGPAVARARDPDPRVRAAALQALGGARGYPALRAIAAGLHDGEAPVRDAALASLRAAAQTLPAQWLLALLHPDPAVRARALEGAPERLEPWWRLHLLADPENTRAVQAWVDRAGVPEGGLGLLVALARAGRADAEQARGWIADRFAAFSLSRALSGLAPPARRRLDARGVCEAAPEALIEGLGPEEPLDHLVDLCLPREGEDAAGERFVEGILEGLARDRRRDSKALAALGAATARALLRAPERLTEGGLALAAMGCPGVLGLEAIPLEARRAAARRLAGLEQIAPPGLGVVERLLAGPLVRGEDGPALTALAGALRLLTDEDQKVGKRLVSPPRPLQAAATAFSHRALVAAARRDPEGALALLRLRSDRGEATELHRALLGAVMDRSRSRPALLARAVAALPSEDLPAVLDNADPGERRALVTGLMAAEAGGALAVSEGRRERLIELLAARLAADLPAALAALLAPEGAVGAIAHQLLLALSAQVEAVELAAAALTLPAPALLRLVTHDREHAPLPLAHHEALAAALAGHPDPALREAAAGPDMRQGPPPPPPPLAEGVVALSPTQHDLAVAGGRTKLARLAGELLLRRSAGLGAALSERGDPAAGPEVAAALVASFEAPEVIGPQLARSLPPAGQRSKVDALLNRHVLRHPDRSGPADAWLHAWEKPQAAFTAWALAREGGLAGVVAARGWGCEELEAVLLRAVRYQVRRWRWREAARIAECCDEALVTRLVEVLLGGAAPAGAARGDRVTLAAEVLVCLHESGAIPGPLATARQAVLQGLGDLPAEALAVLKPWIATEGVSASAATSAPKRALPEDIDGALRRGTDLQALAAICAHPSAAPAVAAARALLALGEPGLEALLEVMLDDPPPPRAQALADAAIDDAGFCEWARALLEGGDGAPEARFAFAMALAEGATGGEDCLPYAIAAAAEPCERGWLRRADWERLAGACPDPLVPALALATSPRYPAYSPAVRLLLDSDDPRALEGLRRFLTVDDRRHEELRCEVARALAARGDRIGEPLLLRDALKRARKRGASDATWRQVFAGATPAAMAWAARALTARGDDNRAEGYLLECLGDDAVTAEVEEALLVLLQETRSPAIQEHALASLEPGASRAHKLRRLAEIFLWGIELGRRLTGRTFDVKLIGGEGLGFTRLEQAKVYINPLPLLRGDRQGAAVVRGLIAHELGHHVYNGDAEGRRCWKQAGKEGLTSLFNLVADEHLERNLRARDGALGDDLKQLAAYAFRHAPRDLSAAELSRALGPWLFEVLVAAGPEPGRAADSLRLASGEVYRALERAGSSFGRFVRALRLGLGDRYGDPKVKQALGLFKQDFRRLDNPGLLERTRALADLFADEVRLLRLLDLHEAMEGEPLEGRQQLEGITDEALRREIDRLRQARERKDPSGARQLNLDPSLHFDRITTVTPLLPDRAAHAAMAKAVARHARWLRARLEALGLAAVPDPRRLRGLRVDRSRLSRAVVLGDPRILVARKRVPAADLFMGVVVDCSGSMVHRDNMEKARRFATLLAEACRGLAGVELRLFGFTDAEIYDAGDAERCAAHAFVAGGGNNDAAALWHAAQVALASRRSGRLLVMVSDGSPTECSVASLRHLVGRLERRHHLRCAQVALLPLEEQCFPHYIELLDDNLDPVVRRFGAVITRLVQATLRSA
jgi:hypothetical protein